MVYERLWNQKVTEFTPGFTTNQLCDGGQTLIINLSESYCLDTDSSHFSGNVLHWAPPNIQGEQTLLIHQNSMVVCGESAPLFSTESISGDFPGGPVAKIPGSQGRRLRFNPWSGN